MSVPSLTAAIRTPKVTTGLAGNVQSERSLNPNYIVNPTRALVDIYGRSSPIDSIDTLTAGFSPEYRMETEQSLRPVYSAYLDVPQGLEGVVENTGRNEAKLYRTGAGSDTMFGNNPGRYDYFGFAPTYKVGGPIRPNFTSLPKEDQSFLKEEERTQQIMNRVYATPRYSAVL